MKINLNDGYGYLERGVDTIKPGDEVRETGWEEDEWGPVLNQEFYGKPISYGNFPLHIYEYRRKIPIGEMALINMDL